MSNDTVVQYNDEEALRYDPTDEEVEAAASATALSYTYQTSAYKPCCR